MPDQKPDRIADAFDAIVDWIFDHDALLLAVAGCAAIAVGVVLFRMVAR